jgi:hypothetical protein
MIHGYFRMAGYLLPVFIVCTSAALLGARARPSGTDPFTPTKAEWLCVRHNMTQMRKWNRDIPYDHYARITDEPNVIEIVLLFLPPKGIDPIPYREMANKEMATARLNIAGLARIFGFDEWLEIRESFQEPEPGEAK